MKTVFATSYQLLATLSNKAFRGLKLLFDPAMEGNPYDRRETVARPKVRLSEQPRFGFRRRLVFRSYR